MELQKRKKQYGTVGKYCGGDLCIKRTIRGGLQRRIGLRRGRNRCLYLAIICICLLTAGGLLFKVRILLGGREISTTVSAAESASASDKEASSFPGEKASLSLFDKTDELLAQTDRAVSQYDYDRAVELLVGSGADKEDPRIGEKLPDIEAVKKTLVEQDIYQVTHIFFHVLVRDPGRIFLDTAQGKGYNSVMTTVPGFEAILTRMHRGGYMLVDIHNLTEMNEDETGVGQMRAKRILLPPGKKAFVASQDDVNCYKYMEGSGCVCKTLLNDRGKPVYKYMDQNGTIWIGEYDLVPILDHFVEEHSDFSCKGAKTILALTRYNGALGYRTSETYDPASPGYDPDIKPNSNIEEGRTYIKKLTQTLKGDGYEFTSHSWGHRDYGKIGFEHMKADIERWEKNVAPLLPDPCDIVIYSSGSDVGNWKPCTEENERYRYLQSLGPRYFCNVGSKPHWVEIEGQFLRQTRRNLDGYRLWMDYGCNTNRLSNLIDMNTVFDARRPIPVRRK